MMVPMKPIFFTTPAEFRKWLKANHAKADEAVLLFYNKSSGKPSMTVAEAVEQALCFGWIDGILRKTSPDSFALRFTPRRKGSRWSEVNIKRAETLIAAGRMQPAGLKAFEDRDLAKTRSYSYEQRTQGFTPELEATFKKKKSAWDFFSSQPPGYQKTIAFWVTSAKQEETRLRRLTRVIEVSTQKQRVDLLAPFGKK